jgi:hypothetical protein
MEVVNNDLEFFFPTRNGQKRFMRASSIVPGISCREFVKNTAAVAAFAAARRATGSLRLSCLVVTLALHAGYE